LLDHRDIGDAVILRQIIGCRQTVTTAADDQHVVARLRFWRTPGGLPAGMAAQTLAKQAEGGIASRHPVPHAHQIPCRSTREASRCTTTGATSAAAQANCLLSLRQSSPRDGGCARARFGAL